MSQALHGHVVVPEEVLGHLEDGPDDGDALGGDSMDIFICLVHF